MFSNTKTRDVRKFSRKPQSKYVASRKGQKLKRREEIETKYTDERFVFAPSAETTEIEKNHNHSTNWIDDCLADLEEMFPEIREGGVGDYIDNEQFDEEKYIEFFTNILEKNY